jgi:hypothetical protein
MPDFRETPPTDAWIARVIELTVVTWIQRGWGYPDQGERIRAMAGLIAPINPRLTTQGQLSTAEYRERLQAEIWNLLSLLEESVREALARWLIADHARQSNIGADWSELLSIDPVYVIGARLSGTLKSDPATHGCKA